MPVEVHGDRHSPWVGYDVPRIVAIIYDSHAMLRAVESLQHERTRNGILMTTVVPQDGSNAADQVDVVHGIRSTLDPLGDHYQARGHLPGFSGAQSVIHLAALS